MPAKIKNESWFSGCASVIKIGIGVFVLLAGCVLFVSFGQMVGIFPDSTEMTQTKVAQLDITSEFLTANAPTATNTPTATETATITQTASITPTSSPSPSATASSSPTITATANPNEIRFQNGQFTFIIQSFTFLREIADYDFINGAGLVILGIVENNASGFSCLQGDDMALVINGQEYPADDILMALFQTQLTPFRDYLGRYGGHCLDAGQKASSFIAFDVPQNAQAVTFRYATDEKSLGINWNALIFSSGEISLQSLYAASTSEPTNAVIRVTESMFATQTATQWTVTPSLTPAPPTATEDNTILQEIQIEGIVRGFTDVDIQDVRIADGRANGGERVVIVSYNSSASNEFDLFAEWISIFDAIDEAIDYHHIDLDSATIIVGNQRGQATAALGVSIQDLDAFINGQIDADEFFRRLTITDF